VGKTISFRHNWGPAVLSSAAPFGLESVLYVCRNTFETLIKKTRHQFTIKTNLFCASVRLYQCGKAR
jgi:hypothetical protein